jgi:putative oxidoreductase
MSYGMLILRIVVGLTFAGHGLQKLAGFWDGPGRHGTRGWLASLGFRAPGLLALLVGGAETSGVLFALGLLTPFAALGLATVMLVAISVVHWRNGFWNGSQGYEFNVALLAGVLAVTAAGPGRFSLDRVIGWDDNLSGLWWAVGALAVAALSTGVIVVALREAPPKPQAEERQHLRAA